MGAPKRGHKIDPKNIEPRANWVYHKPQIRIREKVEAFSFDLTLTSHFTVNAPTLAEALEDWELVKRGIEGTFRTYINGNVILT